MSAKALLIGIQYKGRAFQGQRPGSAELEGSHTDVYRMRDLIMHKYKYPAEGITLMLDDGRDIRTRPTRANIIYEIHRLVKDAKSGDRLFFHFSGHGSQVDDISGDEPDGKDEAIWPVDFREKVDSTYIIDDDLRKWMVDPLPPGCSLTAVFDSCHSGTILDLPNEVRGTPKSTPQSKPIPLPSPSPTELRPPPLPIPIAIPTSNATHNQPPASPVSVTPTRTIFGFGFGNGHGGTPPRTTSLPVPVPNNVAHDQNPVATSSTPPRTTFSILSSSLHRLAPPVTTKEDPAHGLLSLPYVAQGGVGKRARGAAKASTETPSVLLLEPSKDVAAPIGAMVTSWAACGDDQSAYEGVNGAGAMVQALIEALNEGVEHTYASLLQSLSDRLDAFCQKVNAENPNDPPIKQVPQLGHLHKLDIDSKFTL